MICPKCGRPVEANAVICTGCDFILDTEFLGEEILDEEQSLRPGMGGVDPAVFNLADAVILGDIDEQAQSFETSDSGFHVKESTNARLYVSGRSQAMMAPDAVPAVIAQNLADVRLTPFEKHVLSFIDGKRPVEIIRLRAGLDESEVKTALATLADKGVVQVVGRALVDDDSFQETAQRRVQKPRRSSGAMAGVAAALGPLGDETDRAIEEAFRTGTGMSPLGAFELAAPADDDGNVFSSLSGDPLQDALGVGREIQGGLDLPEHHLADLAALPDAGADGGAASPPPAMDTAYTERPRDDDLPSDADSFDVLAHTSEIERRPLTPGGAPPSRPVQRAAADAPANVPAGGTHTRGGLGPMATNARRVLSDPELAEILGDDDDELSHDTRAGERPSGVASGLSQASDGFDDFGDVSELNTALLPGVDSSLSQGAPDSEVFKSVTGTVSTPVMAQPNPAALANLQGRQLASGSSEESVTGLRPQIGGGGLSDLLSDVGPGVGYPSDTPAMPLPSSSSDEGLDADLEESLGPSSGELDGDDGGALLAPAPAGVPLTPLDDGGDLADLVGDDPLSLEGTDTSKVGSEIDEAPDVHSVVTAAPALQVDAMADSEDDVDPFDGLDLEESDEHDALSAAPDDAGSDLLSSSDASREERAVVPVPEDELALSEEGTAAYAENPFAAAARPADDDEHEDLEDDDEDDEDDEDAPTATRPQPGALQQRASSEVSAVFEVESEADEFYEGATDGVPALPANLAPGADGGPSSGALADAFSDDDAPVDEDEAAAPAALDPRNRPPQIPAAAAVSIVEPAPPAGKSERSFASDEELIDDAMIIRPAAATMQVRGASVLERPSPRATPVSAEVSSLHEEYAISAPAHELPPARSVPMPAAPSSQETAHLERPQEIAALSLAAPRSRSEETALYENAGGVLPPSSASELSQGGAWASDPDESLPERGGDSSDSTHVLEGPRVAAPPAFAPPSEASEAPPAEDNGAYEPLNTGSRNDPEAMREKARKLFEDALKDFREGRIGAARMNAKLATIYDPANEEYRTALEQWGKGAKRRAQQSSSYAVLYDEAQEREGAGDIEGAVTLLLQGAEQFPEIAAIQNRLGVLLAIHKREYDRASAYIQRAIELDPENLHYKSNLGKILSRRRERQKRANG